MSRRMEDLTIRNPVLTCCAAVRSTRRVKTVRRLACREADALPADRVMPMRLISKMMPTMSRAQSEKGALGARDLNLYVPQLFSVRLLQPFVTLIL